MITGIVALLFVLCTVPVAAHTGGDHPVWNWDDPLWTEWTSDNELPTDWDNDYFLTNDIDLDEPWVIPEGTTVNLCLNGHLIRQDNTHEHVIEIPAGATLNLYDCGDTVHYYTVDEDGRWTITEDESNYDHRIIGGAITESHSDHASGVWINGGTFNMYGGNIIGNNARGSYPDSGFGGGVHMIDGEFNMYDGKIAGNLAHNGAGVDIDNGVFNMYGGEISHNTATYCGGGVDVEGGTFIMEGGSISHNTVNVNGGGVCLWHDWEDATAPLYDITFIMEGGSISYNTAVFGAGIVVGHGDCTMRGGEISHNTATYWGGGVFVNADDVFTMEGGSITDNSAEDCGGGVLLNIVGGLGGSSAGTIIVSGDAKIKGNSCKGNENNLMPSGYIRIGDAGLSGDANVGVGELFPQPADYSITLVTGVSGSNAKYFSADRATDHIEYNEETGSIMLVAGAPTNPVPDYNEVKITYEIEQRYDILLPTDIVLTPSDHDFENEVNVTALYLQQGKELVIDFSSAHDFHMVLGEPAVSSIKYIMSMGGVPFEGVGFHNIMTVQAGTPKEGEDYWVRQGLYYAVTDDEIAKATFAGEYKDMLTFKIEVKDTP